MPEFIERVTEAFQYFVTDHGFRWAERSDHSASLVARPCFEVCYYLFIRKLPTDGIASWLWVAPPDAPSDALKNLYVGFKIDLGESHKDPDEFILALARRAKVLLPHLSGLVEATKQELGVPAVQSLRLHSYLASRTAYWAVRRYAQSSDGSYCLSMFHKAREVVDHQADWDELEDVAIRIAKKLLTDPNAPDEVRHAHFRNDPQMLGPCLVGPLYIEALAPCSNDFAA
jgi:hypothetical protein